MSGRAAVTKKEGKGLLAMVGIFVLWYGFSGSYNVYNQKMKPLNFPFVVCCIQFTMGLLYVLPMWALKLQEFPKVSFKDVMLRMSPVAILNVLGHAAAVYSMFQSGGGTATHVVKAAEPVVSVILTLLLFGIIPHTFTAFSLVPICYGVAFASTKGNLDWDSCVSTFTTNSAKLAMFSNFCFALRSIVRKQIPQEFKDKVGADNDMALTTILSLAFTIPLALAFEDMDAVKSSWNGLGDAGQLAYQKAAFICGLSFYLYNVFQNSVLIELGPVSTAVGNTFKRIVVFIGLYYFTPGETFPPEKITGCFIAVAGCLMYAVCHAKKI